MSDLDRFEMLFGRHNQHDEQLAELKQLVLSGFTVLKEEIRRMSATVDSLSAEITSLTSAVAAEQSVNASAVTLINGFAAQLAAAVAAAQSAGATPDQLTALSSLSSQVSANTAALAAAVAANTPAAPAAPTP